MNVALRPENLPAADPHGPSARRSKLTTNRALLLAASLTFLASNVVLASGFAILAAGLVLAGCLGAATLLLTARKAASSPLLDAAIDWKTFGICGVVAIALCLLGGETHMYWADKDWLTRDAVLADIVRHLLPVFYKVDGVDYVLRAPLGMYMLPGLAGHVFGLAAGHVALLAQNAFLLAVILYLAASIRGGLPLALLLVIFSGLDVLPWLTYMVQNYLQTGVWKAQGALQWWAGLFQYSAHVTQIFIVPNHALPGWFFAILAILVARRDLDFATLGVSFASLIIWSPLATLAAPFILLFFAWRDRDALLTSPRPWIGAAVAACFLPVAICLVLDAAKIVHAATVEHSGFWPIYFLFIAVEIPHAAIVALVWKRVRTELKGLFAISVLMLLVLPLYSFGPGNDLVMRGSIAPLFLLAFTFCATFLDLGPESRIARPLGVAIIVIGAGVPLLAITFATLSSRFDISACNLVTSTVQLGPHGVSANYAAPTASAPRWLLRAPSGSDSFETIGDKPCWPDHPIQNGGPARAVPRDGA